MARDRVLVRFANPTTNKALHIGHIRGACLGSAAAACLSNLGFQVATHCIMEDVGPHMALAVKGLEYFSSRRTKPRCMFPKPDHEAHGYYIRGGQLCSARLGNGRSSGARVQLWNAHVPDRLMIDWALGSPRLNQLASHIRHLAIQGQSATLEQFGVGFTYRDLESRENPYLYQFIEDGIKRHVFRRLRNSSVVWDTRSGHVSLRCANVHFEESAYLLSFIYRCLRWDQNRWAHIAFAGEEWRRIMKHFPTILQRLGLEKACRLYRVVFYGMVTAKGRKLSSSYGRGLLADQVLLKVKSLPVVRDLTRKSNGVLSALDLSRILIRISLLGVPSCRNVEFSLDAVAEPSAEHWRTLDTISEVCGVAKLHWSTMTEIGKSSDSGEIMRQLAEEAVSEWTFDKIVMTLTRTCEQIRTSIDRGPARRRQVSTMVGCLRLLAVSPLEGTTSLSKAPSLLETSVLPV